MILIRNIYDNFLDIIDHIRDIKEYEQYVLSYKYLDIIMTEIMIEYFNEISDYNEVYKTYKNNINEHIDYIHKNFCSDSILRRYIQSKLFDSNDIRNKYDLYNKVIYFIEKEKSHVSEPYACTLPKCIYRKWYLNNEIDEHILEKIVYKYYYNFINNHKREYLSFGNKVILFLRKFIKEDYRLINYEKRLL